MNTAESQIVMTTTGELFLPTRLVYRIVDGAQFRERFDRIKSFKWDPEGHRWTWLYEHEALKMKFPAAYRALPQARQPIVLASCYIVAPGTFHVYLRCGERVMKFLSFFDRHMPRSCVVGEFIDEYNLITEMRIGERPPMPEDFFKNEAAIEFSDLVPRMNQLTQSGDKAGAIALLFGMHTRTMPALKRLRLDAFYEDGPVSFETAMKLRETLAMLQRESDVPIRPFDVITSLLKQG